MRSVRIKEKVYPQGGCAKLAWLIASIYWVLLYFFRKLACYPVCGQKPPRAAWCGAYHPGVRSGIGAVSPTPPPHPRRPVLPSGSQPFGMPLKYFGCRRWLAGVSLQTVLSQPERRFLEGEQLFPFSFSTRVWKPPRAVGINLPDLVSHLQARRSAPLALGGLVVGLDNHISWKTSVPINPMGLKGPFQPPPSHGARVNA